MTSFINRLLVPDDRRCYCKSNIIIIYGIHMFYDEKKTDFDFSTIRAQVPSLFNDVTLMTSRHSSNNVTSSTHDVTTVIDVRSN